MSLLLITPEVQIPEWEIILTYARSSGPGGQNVNKVNSKAVLRWNLLLSPSLQDEVRRRLLNQLRHRLTTNGELVIASDRFRDQIRNRDDCLEKLRLLLSAALFQAKPRKKTRPSRSSVLKAKRIKKQHSHKKSQRRMKHRED